MAAVGRRELETPTWVVVGGKTRTNATGEGDVCVTLRAESIRGVGQAARDRGVVETAEGTVGWIGAFDPETSEYAMMAGEQYDLPVETYRDQAIAALESLEDGESAEAPTADAAD